jgi:hypothetical protein
MRSMSSYVIDACDAIDACMYVMRCDAIDTSRGADVMRI